MVIAPTDLKLYYSGSTTKNGPGGAQGGMISTFQVPAQTIAGGVAINNTVFSDITNSEAMNGKTRYACLYLKNTHGSQSASSIKMWQSNVTPGQDSIRLGYSGVAANGHDPLLTGTNTSTYGVPLSTSFATLDDQRKRVGFYVTSENAPVYGKTILIVEIYMQRVGTPTGTLNVRQRKRTSETIHTDYGSMNVASISNTAPTLYQFSDLANTGFVHVEDIFTVEYTGGTASNYIQVYRAAGSPVQGMHLVTYTGTQWLSVADFDLCGNMYVAGQSTGPTAPVGVTFENPTSFETAISLPTLTAGSFVPFWLRNDVPANTPNQTNNTSEIRFRVQSPTP
jgi:hypothetical protein